MIPAKMADVSHDFAPSVYGDSKPFDFSRSSFQLLLCHNKFANNNNLQNNFTKIDQAFFHSS